MEAAKLIYAHYLGLEVNDDDHPDSNLLWIAEEALNNKNLPEGWEVAWDEDGENDGVPFFHNSLTDESSWLHPEENKYFTMVADERRKQKEERRRNRRERERDSNSRSYNQEYERDHTSDNAWKSAGNINTKSNDDKNKDTKDHDIAQVMEVTDLEDFDADNDHTSSTAKSSSNTTNIDTLSKNSSKNDRSRSRERDRDRDRDRERSKSRAKEREREREKEDEERKRRSLERERDSASSRISSLEEENERLRRQLRDATDAIDNAGSSTDRQVSEYRERENELNDRITSKSERIKSLEGELESKSREIKDALTRVVDLEEDYKEQLRTSDRKNRSEIDSLRGDINALRARAEAAEAESDASRKALTTARIRAREDALSELESREAELKQEANKYADYSKDMTILREANANISSKLADAMNMVQIATAEADAAKAASLGATSESETSHQALIQATNRLASYDTDMAKIKAELMIARNENDSLSSTIRKLEAKENTHGDRAIIAETEVKRLKAKINADTTAANSRISELSATVSVLQDQLEKSEEHESKAVREVQLILDRTTFENTRLKSAISDLESRLESDIARVLSMERELSDKQDQSFKKDRLLGEEKKRTESAIHRINDVRNKLESEVGSLNNQLEEERAKNMELIQQHRREVEEIRREVSLKIPRIVQQAADQMEAEWAKKLVQEGALLKQRAEAQVEVLRRELLELQTAQVERDARQRVSMADERAELARLRAMVRGMNNNSNHINGMVNNSNMSNMMMTPAPNNHNHNNINGGYTTGQLNHNYNQNYNHNLNDMNTNANTFSNTFSGNESFNAGYNNGNNLANTTGGVNRYNNHNNNLFNTRESQAQKRARAEAEIQSQQVQETMVKDAISSVQTQLEKMKKQLSFSLDLGQSFSDLASQTDTAKINDLSNTNNILPRTALSPTLARMSRAATISSENINHRNKSNNIINYSLPSRSLALGQSPESLFTSPVGTSKVYSNITALDDGNNGSNNTKAPLDGYHEGYWKNKYGDDTIPTATSSSNNNNDNNNMNGVGVINDDNVGVPEDVN